MPNCRNRARGANSVSASRPDDPVVDQVCVAGMRPAPPHAEHRTQFLVQPVAGCGPGEQVPVLREQPPHRPRIGTGSSDAELLQVDTSRVQQPGHVVVVRDQQVRRVTEPPILGEPFDGDMTVRRDDRCIRHAQIQVAGDVPGSRICGKKAIGVATSRLVHWPIFIALRIFVNRLPNRPRAPLPTLTTRHSGGAPMPPTLRLR